MESNNKQPGEESKSQDPVAEVEDLVTAFTISAASEKGINYGKLIQKFGCDPFDSKLMEQFERVTGEKPHRFIRRGMFFCHRELNEVLDAYEKGTPFYLYTGRGPSHGALHMGHAIPFIFTQYLQRVFDVPVVIQITDDEKFLYRPEQTLEQTQKMAKENIREIIAFGFDPEKTFIFMDTEYMQHMYCNVIRFQKLITLNQIKAIFGFNDSDNVGKYAYPPIQAVPAFCNTFPHIFGNRKNVRALIPCAIDQDPYFRMTRDAAARLKYQKPACFYSTFFPALQGLKAKMSSSDPNSSILLNDKAEDVQRKISKYAFSGGGKTIEEHKANGANLDVDVPYQYLRFFFEDDVQLAEIADKYGKGEMSTIDVKNILIKCVQEFLGEFQARLAKVTDEEIKHFQSVRKITPFPKKFIEAHEAKKAQEEAQK